MKIIQFKEERKKKRHLCMLMLNYDVKNIKRNSIPGNYGFGKVFISFLIWCVGSHWRLVRLSDILDYSIWFFLSFYKIGVWSLVWLEAVTKHLCYLIVFFIEFRVILRRRDNGGLHNNFNWVILMFALKLLQYGLDIQVQLCFI